MCHQEGMYGVYVVVLFRGFFFPLINPHNAETQAKKGLSVHPSTPKANRPAKAGRLNTALLF